MTSYKLKKMAIKTGHHSDVAVGESLTGNLVVLDGLAGCKTFETFTEGNAILIQYLDRFQSTTTIKKIVARSPRGVIFETRTSTYELWKVD